ncbi:MAG: xanthine/uracil permease [Paraglaciecola sp.]|jgi:xanthine/uracil permease
MLRSWFDKVASDANKSWADFKVGLGVFVVGVILIISGAQSWYLLQIPGLICIGIGCIIAAKGYLGIFVYRMKKAFKPPTPPSDRDS